MRRCSQVNVVHKNIGQAPLQLSVNVWERKIVSFCMFVFYSSFLTGVGNLLNSEPAKNPTCSKLVLNSP